MSAQRACGKCNRTRSQCFKSFSNFTGYQKNVLLSYYYSFISTNYTNYYYLFTSINVIKYKYVNNISRLNFFERKMVCQKFGALKQTTIETYNKLQ